MFRAITPTERRRAGLRGSRTACPRCVTDEGKLSQILRNFISNALKFTEHGEVRVTARRARPDGADRFAVSDTGIGIAPEDQERIFEEFSQLENALQRKAKGAGLGLPLSRKLAELLGGQLTSSSEPGAGSTFTVTIPARYTEPTRLSDPALRAIEEVQHA